MILLFLLGSCAMQGKKNITQEETPKDSVQKDATDSLIDDKPCIVLASTSNNVMDIKSQQMFSCDMYERIAKECKDNMVCSPIGVEVLYSITRDGANGNTYNELNKVLGIGHNEASNIAKDLNILSDKSATTISMANLIVVNKPFSLKPAFASNAKTAYGSEIWSKPFNTSTLSDVNHWISKKTNGMIPNGIDALKGVMCGVNTIYFNGEWNEPFDVNATRPTVFTNATGKKVKVMMMSQRSHFRYMKTKSFQVLAMPYKQRIAKNTKMNSYSLYVFLPLPGKGFSTIMDYIKGKPIDEMKSEMLRYGRQHYGNRFPMVNVKFPRLEVSSKIDVVSVMKSLGVKSAFEANADFRKISGDDVYISNSQQKAIIRIDEEGTEAVAMTEYDAVLGCLEGQMTKRPKEAFFYANHPFIYMIVCEDTNTILFIGQYTDGLIKNERGVWVSDSNIESADVLSYRHDEAEKVSAQQMNKNGQAEDHVYDIVEQMPSFPGGISQAMLFIQISLRYPAVAKKEGIQGRVILTFVVETDGRLTDIKVAKSISPSLDEEAVRIVKSMPKWIPGKQNGIPVRVRYTLPVSFRL